MTWHCRIRADPVRGGRRLTIHAADERAKDGARLRRALSLIRSQLNFGVSTHISPGSMPQWSRDRKGDQNKYPDERRAARCPRAAAAQLLRYDHHVVWIDGRPALLRTYHWAATAPENWAEELPFEVSFTYAPGHPAAPGEIQRIVDALSFASVDTSTEQANER